MIKVGIDTGGTFTDFVISDGGKIHYYKIPSTPSDPSIAIIDGLKEVLGKGYRDADIIHGTTVATNTLLERKGAKVALITTKGFEDVIEIGRQNRAELYDLFWQPPEPLVASGLRFGINERINYEGRVLKGVDIRDVMNIYKKLTGLKIDAIAISFLNSYTNPKNENRVEGILKPLGLPISVSSKILPEFREYERTSTIVANAYLQPKVNAYMRNLSEKLGYSHVSVMQSSGGVISPAQAGDEPVRILLSGPAGGVVGGFKIAKMMGFRNIITYDMGGTSTDIALCHGSLIFKTETTIDGIPIKMPMVDVSTIGAGGGSLAYIDSGKVLKVGPESAGADPGPACYGKASGATVTDANVVLGRIDPAWFLGGRMRIFPRKSFAAIKRLSGRLRLSVIELAEGIIKVSNANMERALRVISIGRGYDPRDFVLFSFGGAGGLHACELALGMGIKTVVFPKDPGVLSAMGMLMAESFKDYSITTFLSGKIATSDSVENGFRALEERAKRDFTKKLIGYKRFLDVRYKRQSHELMIPFTKNYKNAFHRMHRRNYGFSKRGDEIEIVTLRLRAIAEHAAVIKLPLLEKGGRRVGFMKREIYFNSKKIKVASYIREDFYGGYEFNGPALILENTSTLFIPPDFVSKVDEYGNILAKA